MKIETSLSSRGVELAKSFGAFEKFKDVFGNPYDPDKNPKGLINIGVAENVSPPQDPTTILTKTEIN